MTKKTSESTSSQAAKTVLVLFCGLWCLNLLLHLPSFSRGDLPPNYTRFPFSGDEFVYLTLARRMQWDGSDYSTMRDPEFMDRRKWTNAIYRKPLFHHGPALPYVLKSGAAVAQYFELEPSSFWWFITVCAFLAANVVMAIYFLLLWRLMGRLNVPPAWQVVGYVGAALGPLILFSTTRLHHDAIAGILITSGLIAYVEAIERRSITWAVGAGVLISLALNFRYNSLLAIPLFVAFHIYAIWREQRPAENTQAKRKSKQPSSQPASNGRAWLMFLITSVIIATVGMQHFYRILQEYGTLNPGEFVYLEHQPGDAWQEFKAEETRTKMLFHLFLTLPVLCLFFLPASWKAISRGLRERQWGAAFVMAFLFLFLVMAVASYSELRFFAFCTPMLYCCLPYVLSQAWPNSSTAFKYTVPVLLIASLFTMTIVGYHYIATEPDQVVIQLNRAFDLLPAQNSQY